MTTMQRVRQAIARFRRDEGGAFAMVFGVMALVLIALGGAVVDYVSLEQSRNRAQLALDAAVLALQPEITRPGFDEESIRARAEALVIERIGNSEIRAEIDQVSIDPVNGSLFLSGIFVTQTSFVRLVGVPELAARFSSEAVRGILDIEVAVALDITGSMDGQRIVDLKAAAKRLIDSVVQDDQTLNMTRMALVPYAQAVNVFPYQQAIRGPERAPMDIQTVSWASGSEKTITAASRDSNDGLISVTSARHGFVDGDWVYVWNLPASPRTISGAFQISNVARDSFNLAGSGTFRSPTASTSSRVIKCERRDCEVLVNSLRHGYVNGDYVHVTGVHDMPGLNDKTFDVKSAARDTLVLGGSSGGGNPAKRTHTPNTGKLHCTWQTADVGCTYYRFTTAAGGTNTMPLTNCVTDHPRNPTGDVAFSINKAGRNYATSYNPCVPNPIVPLTTNKDTLRAAIDSLSVAGSTAGNLGIAWAWHVLSPNMGYVWPGGSQPASYDGTNLLKAAIIMTDGEFNTVHCNGVVARNSTDGSGDRSYQIGCDAPNGAPYSQARAYCDAMKATNSIIIFTVGFAIAEGSAAAELLSYCATSSANYFLAESASGLDAAFQQIASNISALRIAR